MPCEHKNTYYEDWPNGRCIEICLDYSMSRHHWEQGQSEWVIVKDIAGAKERVQESINEMRDVVCF